MLGFKHNFLTVCFQVKEATRKIAEKFNISGPFNTQFLAKNNDIMVSIIFNCTSYTEFLTSTSKIAYVIENESRRRALPQIIAIVCDMWLQAV